MMLATDGTRSYAVYNYETGGFAFPFDVSKAAQRTYSMMGFSLSNGNTAITYVSKDLQAFSSIGEVQGSTGLLMNYSRILCSIMIKSVIFRLICSLIKEQTFKNISATQISLYNLNNVLNC